MVVGAIPHGDPVGVEMVVHVVVQLVVEHEHDVERRKGVKCSALKDYILVDTSVPRLTRVWVLLGKGWKDNALSTITKHPINPECVPTSGSG